MTKAAAAERAAAALAGMRDLYRSRRPAGQVLVYVGHLPQSLFLILDGAVRLDFPGGRESAVRRTADEGPFLVPDPRDLGEPAGVTVVLASETEMVFIPRSLAGEGSEVAGILEDGGVGPLSLANAARQGRIDGTTEVERT